MGISAPPLPHPHQTLCGCSCCQTNRLLTPDYYVCSLAYAPAPPPGPTPLHPHTAFVTLLSLSSHKEPPVALILVGLFSLVQWVSILAFPLVQAAQLNTLCHSLRNLGRSVRSRPLSYTRMSYLHLDSFLSYTATQQLPVSARWSSMNAGWVFGSAGWVSGSAGWVSGSAHWVCGSAQWVSGSAHWVSGSAHWVCGSAHWVSGSAHWVSGSAHWVSGSAHWVSASAGWVSVSAGWVSMSARWVPILAITPNMTFDLQWCCTSVVVVATFFKSCTLPCPFLPR